MTRQRRQASVVETNYNHKRSGTSSLIVANGNERNYSIVDIMHEPIPRIDSGCFDRSFTHSNHSDSTHTSKYIYSCGNQNSNVNINTKCYKNNRGGSILSVDDMEAGTNTQQILWSVKSPISHGVIDTTKSSRESYPKGSQRVTEKEKLRLQSNDITDVSRRDTKCAREVNTLDTGNYTDPSQFELKNQYDSFDQPPQKPRQQRRQKQQYQQVMQMEGHSIETEEVFHEPSNVSDKLQNVTKLGAVSAADKGSNDDFLSISTNRQDTITTVRNVGVGQSNFPPTISGSTSSCQLSIHSTSCDLKRLVSFRSVKPKDRVLIQHLHEEWFPVRYQDEFYDDLVHNRFYNSQAPLYTSIAVIPKTGKTSETASKQQQKQYDLQHQPIQVLNHPDIKDSGNHSDDITSIKCNGNDSLDLLGCDNVVGVEGHRPAEEKDQNDHVDDHDDDDIVGCVVGSLFGLNQVSVYTRQLLINNPSMHTHLFYIMTLGTCTPYRHAGLGTILIQKCIEYATSHKKCGAIYLHVIVSNAAAIRFYEKLGFYRVAEIQNYYVIDNEHHNCFLYARYMNGNLGHRNDIRVLVKEITVSIWKNLTENCFPLVHKFVMHVINVALSSFTSSTSATSVSMSRPVTAVPRWNRDRCVS